ncbi:MAG: hypothetical protein KF799_09000 [Bdellovibrionales bacterium]|nr:hypothetical protein [Bdellovibrionales bacterium]
MRALLLPLTFFIAFVAKAEPLNDPLLQKSIAEAVEHFAEKWRTRELGEVWITPYFDRRGRAGELIEGEPDSFEFEVIARNADRSMDVEVGFVCGSELNYTELIGSCRVHGELGNGHRPWIVEIKSCSCE